MKKIIEKNKNVTANSKQIEILKNNFPNCFDKNGRFLPDKLNSIINDEVEISSESYELNWLGKKYARLLANQEVTTMLTEDIEHNLKPENINSQNLYIEGDNLEVLKHMVNSYNKQIKIIYIDPPYNTGTDFIYKDDRKYTVEELSKLANVDKEEAKRILEFTESNSNSHSAWLTFMYPRLYVARELLSDDGIIFISIDENEQAQLKLLCDDLFGVDNLIFNMVRKVKTTTNHSENGTNIQHEYCYVYSKNIKLKGEEKDLSKYTNPDNDPNGDWTSSNPSANNDGRNNPNLFEIKNPLTGQVDIPPKGRHWAFSEEKFKEYINSKRIIFKNEIKNNERGFIYKGYKKELKSNYKAMDSILYDNKFLNQVATREQKKLLNDSYFDYPKSVVFVKTLINSISKKDGIILDFFSGSSTTAHAVMKLNAEDGGNRKFIMVQLPEEINMKNNLRAYKFCTEELNDKPIIPTIAKERIKRASELIKEENSDKEYINNIDYGFKVFKTKPIIETNYFNGLDKFSSDQTELLVTNDLSNDELSDLLLTWKLHDGIEFTKSFNELMLDDYIVHYVDDKAYFMYKDFTNRNIIQLLEELDDIDSIFAVRNLIVFASNFTSKEQRELVEAIKGYKNKKKIELNIELRY